LFSEGEQSLFLNLIWWDPSSKNIKVTKEGIIWVSAEFDDRENF
jgi:hypothetical protein